MTGPGLRCGALLVLLLAAAAPMSAQPVAQDKPQPQPGEARCGTCSTTGRVPVELDRKFSAERDQGQGWAVEFCSEAAVEGNWGLDWLPCPRCRTPSLHAPALAEYEERRTAGEAWLTERRRVDRVTRAEKPLLHVRTTHFTVTTDYPRIVTDRKQTLRLHELGHLYAKRLEDFYARYKVMFGIEDSENLVQHHTLYLFEREQQAALAGPAYTGLQGGSTVKRAGGVEHESVVVTWWDKGEFPRDQDMWRHQLHNFTHQFTAVYYDVKWFPPYTLGLMPPWLNDRYGWLDEGLAHWFEIDYDGNAATYCFREQNVTSRWGGSDWRKNLLKAVTDGDIPSLADVSTKPSQALTAKEHQFVWSWVDFLLARDETVKMGLAMRRAKEKASTFEILREVWGLTTLDFQSTWSAWVLENYGPTKKR